MKFSMGLSLVASLLASFIGSPSWAAEWALTAKSSTGLYETDVSTLSVKQEIVQSWMRETLERPAKDAVTHKTYVATITQRSDDCQRRRYALGEYIRRDAAGVVAASGQTGGGWQDVVPGSVAESIWRATCVAFNPPKQEPWLASISAGEWRVLGRSTDNKYSLSLKSDQIIKVKEGFVLTVVRSEYASPEWIDGYAVKYIVAASLTDCVNEKNASAGADFYISPSLRVRAARVDDKEPQFVPIAPGSFLANSIKDICATATQASTTHSEPQGGLVSGTAWAGNKGYLITSSHVIEGGKKILVYSNGVRVGEAKVVLDDPANDLALLKFAKPPSTKLKILPIADHGAPLGKSVFTLGYPEPEALGQNVKMTAGQISSTTGFRNDARLLQISIPIQEGNSGGPVISLDGVVFGVVKSKLTRFDDDDGSLPPENVNYAVKASYIRPLLEDLPDLGNYEVVKAGNQDELVASATAAVFMLIVSQ